MFDFIYSAMGWILKQLYYLVDDFGGFALAILLFTVLVNLVFLPLNFSQQKSQSKQTAVRPKLDALKEQCGDDKQRYNTEMQALYKREGVKMMGGCLTALIRLPFLWGVWQAIRSPLQYIINIDSVTITNMKEALVTTVSEFSGKNASTITDLDVIHHFDAIKASFPDFAKKVTEIDFHLFGFDLTFTPEFSFNFGSVDLKYWIFPLLSFATAMLSSIVMLKIQKKSNPDAAQMGGMMLLMPILSLVIAFGVPSAVGFYWACSNVVNMLITICMNIWFGPYKIIARNEAKAIKRRREYEKTLKVVV